MKIPAAAPSHDLAWTLPLRKLVHGSPWPHPLDAKIKLMSADAAWKALREVDAQVKPYRQPLSASTPRAFKASVDAVHASYARPSAPELGDLQTELFRFRILFGEHYVLGGKAKDALGYLEALVALWSEKGGVPFVLDLLVRFSLQMKCESAITPGRSVTLRFDEQGPKGEVTRVIMMQHDAYWWTLLRPRVLALAPGAYAAARDHAAALRAELPEARATLAYLFPREPWADEDAVELLSRASFGHLEDRAARLLLGAQRDPARALALATPKDDLFNMIGMTPFALDMVDALGSGAADAAATILELSHEASSRKVFAQALALADPRRALKMLESSTGPLATALRGALK